LFGKEVQVAEIHFVVLPRSPPVERHPIHVPIYCCHSKNEREIQQQNEDGENHICNMWSLPTHHFRKFCKVTAAKGRMLAIKDQQESPK
jgi:hypothetical protein